MEYVHLLQSDKLGIKEIKKPIKIYHYERAALYGYVFNLDLVGIISIIVELN